MLNACQTLTGLLCQAPHTGVHHRANIPSNEASTGLLPGVDSIAHAAQNSWHIPIVAGRVARTYSAMSHGCLAIWHPIMITDELAASNAFHLQYASLSNQISLY